MGHTRILPIQSSGFALSEGRSIRLLYCLKSYFPAGESALSKKMPGLEKIREIREKENQL